ncbi:MAG: hypothetical protein COA45_06510 [Zetaproteobacteria bacterium]|nr:MAG: hypothetical protein COA45_06510 [Zetaproteobacteria bacterium]
MMLYSYSGSSLFNTSRATEHTQTRFPDPWPPILNQAYPDLELIDQDGESFKLSYLKGKVIIIEPIGMNCPACQAFSGAHDYGAFKNNAIEKHSQSFRKIFPLYAKGLELPSKDVIFVQLLLYDMRMGKPTPKNAREWARHFKIYKKNNHFVAVSPYDMRSDASFKMIPGFQLIDRNFILRIDSTGHSPKHGLYKHLIPMTPKFVKQIAK